MQPIHTGLCTFDGSKIEKTKNKANLDFLATVVILLVIKIYLTNHYFCQYFSIKPYVLLSLWSIEHNGYA